jgi:hypothetical protein
MELADLLCGLYMANRKRLALYWNDGDGFERFAADDPVITGLSASMGGRGPLSLAHQEKLEMRQEFVPYSAEVDEVFRAAGDIASSSKTAVPGRRPLVAPEDLLLALAQFAGSGIGKRLVETGLNLDKLQLGVNQIRRQAA